MGAVLTVRQVKLICGIIARSGEISCRAESMLTARFGPLDYKSPYMEFNFTDYYEGEMGTGLKRCFISFRELISPERLACIKLTTNKMEEVISAKPENGRRLVNIDPGYLTDAKLVLASTKDYCHRVYLDKGIYAEATLSYKAGSYRPYDWTYPDYRTQDYIEIFNEIRAIYMKQRPG